MENRDFILLYINGTRHEVRGSQAFISLSDYLREVNSLTGTKIVCEEGDCGACTILLGKVNSQASLEYKSVNSCILFMYQLDCRHIVTIEGLKKKNENGKLDAKSLTNVQQAFMKYHGAQCGFCTPGFVMCMTGALHNSQEVNAQSLCDDLTGNLCRCTGYEPIIKAGLQAAAGEFGPSFDLQNTFDSKAIISEIKKSSKQSIILNAAQGSGHPNDPEKIAGIPADLKSALDFKKQHPTATVVAGGTDIGVQINKGRIFPESLLSLTNLTVCHEIKSVAGTLEVGALVSWTQLEEYTVTQFPELNKIINIFAAPQIRNTATIGGNIINGSPIADFLPLLYALDAQLELASVNGTRLVGMNDFYTGYKKSVMKPEEILVKVSLPMPDDLKFLKLYKVSKRKHLDISTLTAAIYLPGDQNKISSARIAFGGVGPNIIRTIKTEKFFTGKARSLETFNAAGELAVSEIVPIDDVRGSKDFRYALAKNILTKYFYETEEQHVGSR